jgi:hypothetical protein
VVLAEGSSASFVKSSSRRSRFTIKIETCATCDSARIITGMGMALLFGGLGRGRAE